MNCSLTSIFLILVASALRCAAVEEMVIRTAVTKSLPLLERSSITAISERSNCFTCHHTGLPAMAAITARSRAFKVSSENLQTQLKFTADFLAKNRAGYLNGKGQGGQALTAGSALWVLGMGEVKPDATTEAVIEYLLSFQKDLGHWKPQSIRPPSEESPFSTTFVVLESLRKYGTSAQQERITERREAAKAWMLKTSATSTEDRVFKLASLVSVSAERSVIDSAVLDLLHTQREDGGWAQRDDMTSDAYATGTALTVLHQSGGLAVKEEAYQRGLSWLCESQLPDGSWHVHTRSKPIQSYFESDYPHGKDQFISITAACWATTALALALPVSP